MSDHYTEVELYMASRRSLPATYYTTNPLWHLSFSVASISSLTATVDMAYQAIDIGQREISLLIN